MDPDGFENKGQRASSRTVHKKKNYGGDDLIAVPLVKKVSQLNDSDEEEDSNDGPTAPIIRVESDDSSSVG